MSRILVTGANGFVGRSVCRALRKAGHTLSGTSRDSSLRAGPENIPMYHTSEIDKNTDWQYPVSGADAVVHLAARVHLMMDDASNPLAEYRRVNLYGTCSLAKAAASAGVKRLVFLSTVKANGDKTTDKAFSEKDIPLPESPYAVSKLEAEQALSDISDTYGMEVVILRAPLVYGPHVKGNFFALLDACARRKALPLGGVSNRRSFLYVNNLASAVMAGLNHPAAAGKTFLVSDGEDLSTPDLVRQLSSFLGVEDNLFSVPLWLLRGTGSLIGKGDAIDRLTRSLQVDISLIKNDLSWSPPVSVQDGLRETARWYLEN